jgi:outer membrane protein TolC
MRIKTAILIILTLLPAMARATPADLPDAQAALAALDRHPLVRAAQAKLRAAQAEHRRLKAGSHEYGLRLNAQRREVRGGPDHGEWEAAIERGVRLPDKARLDDRIGAVGVAEAMERVGDARHEAARQLLTLWYALLQAQAEARLWREQVALLETEARIVGSRVRAGDAARMQTLQAEAALAQAVAQQGQAEARARMAEAELRRHYPELPAPTGLAAEPVLPEGGEARWVEQTLAHNHELLAAQRASERARLLAQRAGAERRPDPVLGLHYANEQGGHEHVLGLSLSLALPGEGRRAAASLQAAEAEALAEAEAATRRRLTAESAANWLRAAGAVEVYRRAAQAADAASRHADLTRRAHELGELGLAEVLLARRTALETRIAAERSRLTANEAIARLLLDAHLLWPLAGEDGHP